MQKRYLWGSMRSRIIALVAASAVWAAGNPASGQTGRPITFDEARSAAAQRGPAVLLATRRTGVAEAEVDVAGSLANPTLTITSARETARIGASVGVPVPLFGQRARAVDAAQAEARSARLDVAAAEVEARFQATVAWIDLWEAQERGRLSRQAAAEATRVASIADQKFQAGAGPQVDVLRTRADRVRAEAEAAGAEAAVRAAGIRLTASMGLPDAPEVTAAGPPGFDGAGGASFGAVGGRIDQAPLLRRDAADVAAAASRVRLQQRLRWPMVNLLLTVNQGDPTLPGVDVIGGVSLDAPILNLRGGAIRRARAEQAVAQTVWELDAARVRTQAADAAARAQAAGARARALAAEVLPALETARQMTEEGYRDGRVDLLRLIEAQRAVLDARFANAEAQASWQRAIADLERAAGVARGTLDAR